MRIFLRNYINGFISALSLALPAGEEAQWKISYAQLNAIELKSIKPVPKSKFVIRGGGGCVLKTILLPFKHMRRYNLK